MTRLARIIICLAAFVSVFGCAGLEPGFETPTVGVSSFRVLPSAGVAPEFEIGLRIVNPNRSALKLEGIVYSVTLAGHKVLTGVSSDLPVIGAYGEGDVTLTATPDLLSSISLFATLMKQPQSTFAYELDAKLDIGSLRPRIHVQEKGEISLEGAAK
ncbi:MAG: LEA type 2 family protein [Desulfuromonadales bacterium]|nr:LEA type 2 family protein [Desulfuromonadales bacterium]